jgi:serine/threonine protein phosphatase PrpC
MSTKARNVNALMMAHQNVNVKNVDPPAFTAQGSTSVLANRIDDDLYISNLGDSRAIL